VPEMDISEYAKLEPSVLESMRRAIVAKAAGSHDNLDLDDLRTLAAITGVLRRRASGPPKAVKAKSSPRTKAAPAQLDDLA
jgi:hypothetical protein